LLFDEVYTFNNAHYGEYVDDKHGDEIRTCEHDKQHTGNTFNGENIRVYKQDVECSGGRKHPWVQCIAQELSKNMFKAVAH
jgi:hypothetical protein